MSSEDRAARADGNERGQDGNGQYAQGLVRRDVDESHHGELTFPDLPRMELDQLLTQLVERAQEVIATQGRLRGLLRANQLVIGGLDLQAVLRRIVDAARELVGARYAALGVIAPAGGLAEFVHTGISEDAVERIGHLPQGKGLLGALIDDPRPIRLARITDDERSSGFPPAHPPMTSFLGVPIRIRDEVFGNLYLTESTRGEFSAEDEELCTAIAATAAVAIENARLYEAARSRGEWLQASATITRQLLSPDEEHAHAPLQLIARRCLDVADADLVTVALPDGGELRIEEVADSGEQYLRGVRLAVAGSLLGRVFTTGRPVRMPHLDDGAERAALSAGHLDVGPVLVVPLLGAAGPRGVLAAVREHGRIGFTDTDLDMASSFANHAAIAVELAEARAKQQRAAMLDERDRIAADLHDQVIQRLFAAGLSLQSVAMSLGQGRTTDRILATVADLDATISQIRTTIFELHDQRSSGPDGLRARLVDVATDAAKALGFDPSVRFDGPVDTVPSETADDLVAVLREALTNVARHARARSASVELSVGREQVNLCVHDDGIGFTATSRASGLANMHRRAERHQGECQVVQRRPSGTTVRWTVPGS
ncbi:GAF domain-containing protein [Pseudonocardia cypriaca]|uniref:Histidine kinase n=1 Tax=Pseudonocardia cypriaca TaxID=882449 RepID=A0A543FS06_9PSEU|nr:GAF domain-containing protein [Pseudonocardia cypriaca]TQM36623.1 histidine kinase [Pseudonocardia cypriaca]